jgi:hypothetical protein
MYDMFHLPLSTISHEEMQNVHEEMQEININRNHDECKFTWGDYFSTKKVNKNLIGRHETCQTIMNIWKSCNHAKTQILCMGLTARKIKD